MFKTLLRLQSVSKPNLRDQHPRSQPEGRIGHHRLDRSTARWLDGSTTNQSRLASATSSFLAALIAKPIACDIVVGICSALSTNGVEHQPPQARPLQELAPPKCTVPGSPLLNSCLPRMSFEKAQIREIHSTDLPSQSEIRALCLATELLERCGKAGCHPCSRRQRNECSALHMNNSYLFVTDI